ncbi:tRNA uridine-5-carboxymethylaminomethyl(34) synthesis GTPase MnmE [Thermosyntropha sp.]|uniref:tRNA uridine-5-carboxymethylaminomethyl(34) synthesis GTPase MnmE n=1 Tax=Thermosyntropha sp. TaxID=2740820 RepID=UPI0025F756C2|nr:tRNA uridine-5-carboxymethylaminomethyl(34) synthesis GTPase MnmE [Thermosyntropha sp.]MBO8159690.1 tRNA uridine-5-carboxymethylaminomethyl(34) synthesis GTPase MnmE [Thermosyntropha sp.]
MLFNDDIAAIATPPGEGGIAIIRLSGSSVIEKVSRIFKPYNPEVDIKNKPGYTMTLGWILDDKGEYIDEVLVSIMRAPKSYTGEDVVEINCHGGILPARKCLEEVLNHGIRLAEPGEFTRRAFLNGRMDMSQVEAVIEIIRAKSEKSMKLALKQLKGEKKEDFNRLEDILTSINAAIEASIDFPDEVDEPDYAGLEENIKIVLDEVNKFIEAARRGEVYREGIKIVISGKPNVGKSSLLNLLLRKDKAIVTDIPGTTRDIVEDYLNINGIPVKIMDTAGIRETDDIVERIGVEKSGQAIKEADLVIFLLDVASGITEEDIRIYQGLNKEKVIVLVNKEDLAEKNISEEEIKKLFGGVRVIRGSVKEKTGLDELISAITEMVLEGKTDYDGEELIFNLRQQKALEKAREHLISVLDSLGQVPLDCTAVDVRGALEALGEITGKNIKEEIINRIFQDFCIGK